MIVLRGMYGVGDNIHQRAIVREMMQRDDEVMLETFYSSMYHDLVAKGLRLHELCGVPQRIKDEGQLNRGRRNDPKATRTYKINYHRDSIIRHGNILAAQFACVGLPMPAKPDFSLPVPEAWRARARSYLTQSNKPLMVYRPSVLNSVWRSEARSPDTVAYATLYRSIRDKFHVVSVANLGDAGEHIYGEEQEADQKFHHGELSFEALAGLFAEAKLAFTCPGFAPVLSQAVGTPTVIVYGGNENFRSTNCVGAHLAPTLAIESIRPCDCHWRAGHNCVKTIDMPPALARLEEFVCAS